MSRLSYPNVCRLPACGLCKVGAWAGLLALVLTVLSGLPSLTLPTFHVQATMETHLEQRLCQPQKLLQDLREADAQQFCTAMKYLWEDKRDHIVSSSCIHGVGEVQDQLAFVELK